MKHRTLLLTAVTAAACVALLYPATPVAVEPAVAEAPVIGIAAWGGDPDVSTVTDVVYGTAPDGSPLTLDVCLPISTDDGEKDDGEKGAGEVASRRPAVVEIHGGGWTRGDKGDPEWQQTCRWLASEGYVTVNVNYRLAPAATYPATIDDITGALRWLRDPAVAERFGVDPGRIAAFGGSAGGNLAALLGMRGSGSWTSGDRVAAVVTVSGPMDLTAHGQTFGQYPDWLTARELAYLGCERFDGCAVATAASPVHQVDPTDPPVLVAQTVDEFIPVGQSEAFADALAASGVEHQLDIAKGEAHSTAALDEALRDRVAAFLADALGTE